MRVELRVGRAVPQVCARHGEPAVARRVVVFSTQPAPWNVGLLIVPLLAAPLFLFRLLPFSRGWIGVAFAPYFVAWLSTRSTVRVDNWPLCERCLRRARRVRIVGRTVIAAGLAGGVAGIALAVSGIGAGYGVALVGAVVVTPLGAGALVGSKVVGRPWAFLTRDGERIVVLRAREAFARAVRRPREPID